MGMIILALVASYIPSLLFFFWFRNARKDADYRKTCTKVLVGGLLSVIPITFLSMTFNIIERLLLKGRVPFLLERAAYDFLVIALAEELVKFFTGNKRIKERLHSIGKFDVAAFLTISACGFNITESAVYAIGSDVITVLVRGVTALHEFYGLIMGYYYAKYLQTKNRKYFILAFLIPVFLHGLYDYSLTPELLETSEFLVLLPFIAIIASWIFGLIALRKVRKGKKDGSYMIPICPETAEQ